MKKSRPGGLLGGAVRLEDVATVAEEALTSTHRQRPQSGHRWLGVVALQAASELKISGAAIETLACSTLMKYSVKLPATPRPARADQNHRLPHLNSVRRRGC